MRIMVMVHMEVEESEEDEPPGAPAAEMRGKGSI